MFHSDLQIGQSLDHRFLAAVESVTARAQNSGFSADDEDVTVELKRWLDATGQRLSWAGTGVTADEWFFVTTLYGEMTLDGQRTHIRKFFPMFVSQADRDIRNLTPEMLASWQLRSHWMRTRLCRMASVLNESRSTMETYAAQLRDLETRATPGNPTPALDTIVRDHRATSWKTLSCFVRDCIQGNCFPIDTRVEKVLMDFGLPNHERSLVSLCLKHCVHPRSMARMFYQAGGAPLDVAPRTC